MSEKTYDINFGTEKFSLDSSVVIAFFNSKYEICKFNNLVCVSFEKKMRTVCRKDNIKSIGLLGILREAIRLKIIDNKEATNLVYKFKDNDFLYLGGGVLDEIIEAIDEFN